MHWRWNILLALAKKDAEEQIEMAKRWTPAPKWSWLPKTGVNRKCSKRVQIGSVLSRDLHWAIFSQCWLKRVRYFALLTQDEPLKLCSFKLWLERGLASSLQASRFGISAYVGGRTNAWLQISAKVLHPCRLNQKLSTPVCTKLLD